MAMLLQSQSLAPGKSSGSQSEPLPIVAEHVHRMGSRPRRNPLFLQPFHEDVSRERRLRFVDAGDERLPGVATALRLRR